LGYPWDRLSRAQCRAGLHLSRRWGQLTLNIGNSDFNKLGGVVVTTIVGVSLATLILDLAYPLLDPRIRTTQG